MTPEKMLVDNIRVGSRHRALSGETVAALAKSMGDIGLQTPITVCVQCDGPLLVTGLHRLEAARQLGWETIPVWCADMTDIEREMWEISENLHRSDLTKGERDNHIRRYAELLTEQRRLVPQNAEQVPVMGRPKSVTTEIAEQTGLSDDTVRRALEDKPRETPVLSEQEIAHKEFAKLVTLWSKSGPGAQKLFLEFLE